MEFPESLRRALANLSLDETAALLRAMQDSSDEDEGPSEIPSDGRGDEIASHHGAVAMMDMARQFAKNEDIVNAAVRGDTSQLAIILDQKKVNVNIRDGIRETALFGAVCHDHLGAATLLLEAGADPDMLCSNNWAALHAVSRSGNEAMAKMLLGHRAKTEVRDSCGWVPLHIASLYGNNSIVTALLEKGANPNAKSDDGRIPLHTAVDYGHEDVIRNLVGHRANLNAQDNDGQTPLHISAMPRPFPPLVSLLLDLGANPTTSDANGNTALHLAVLGDRDPISTVVPLLRRHANTNIANSDSHTPLMYAIIALKKVEDFREGVLATLLDDKNTDLNCIVSQPNGETTPLIFAIETRNAKAVKMLLSHHVDVGFPVKRHGCNLVPVVMAVACENPEEPEILKMLLDAGANSNTCVDEQISLAHLAALKDHKDCLRVLLDGGAHVNSADTSGSTPLHIAAEYDKPECISIILERGPKVDAKDQRGSTALLKAAKAANEQCIKLLIAAGADMTTASGRDAIHAMQEKIRGASDPDQKEKYLRTAAMMLESLANTAPELNQLISGDKQEGWFLAEVDRLGSNAGTAEPPRGPTLSELRSKYLLGPKA